MGAQPPKGKYNKGHLARVVGRARVFLDITFPIDAVSHADARRFCIQDDQLLIDDCPLAQREKFVGYVGRAKAPDSILLRNNGLHVVLIFDRAHPIESRDQALRFDVQIESAFPEIMDSKKLWPV